MSISVSRTRDPMEAYPAPVQVPISRTMTVGKSEHRQSYVLFLVSFVLYGLLGYWLLNHAGLVNFGAVDRLTRAFLVWHNSPPKLAAIGFSYPPMQVLAMLPFALIVPFASSLVALPIYSAFFGALLLTVMNRLFCRCEIPGLLRILLLLGFALTPLLVFYSTTGDPTALSLYLLALAMGGVVAWFISIDMRYLVVAGFGFTLVLLSNYLLFPWLILAALMIAMVLVRHNAGKDEVEASLITLLCPVFYAFAIWIIFSAVIVGDPFAWISGAGGAAVNTASSAAVHVSFTGLLYGTFLLIWDVSPLTFIVVPVLLFLMFSQKNELAAWLVGFTLIAIFTPMIQGLAQNNASEIQLVKGLPILLITVIGVAWIYKSVGPGLQALVGTLAAIGLIVGIIVGWGALATFPYQNGAQAFQAAIRTRNNQEGTFSKGGIEVGISSEAAMANYIDEHITKRKSILTDNAQTFGVILLTGKPQLFVTRIDNGDARWVAELKNPPSRVHYFLIAKNASADLIRQTYPKLGTANGDPRFTTLYETSRYVLVSVPDGLGEEKKSTTTKSSGITTHVGTPSVPSAVETPAISSEGESTNSPERLDKEPVKP